MSAGVTIRRATPDDAEAIALVRIEGWRQAYKGLVPQASLDAMNLASSLPLWQRALAVPTDRAGVFVAVREGAVAGFAAGTTLAEAKYGLDAELTAIYLARELQRQGLGRRLAGTIAADRATHGATGMIVWVLADHAGARRFCEALGAERVAEQPFEWDGKPLVEAGYGWRDLAALVAAAGLKALH